MVDKISGNYDNTPVLKRTKAQSEAKSVSLFAKPDKIKEIIGSVNGDDNHVIKIGKNFEGKKIAVDSVSGEELVATDSKKYITRKDFDEQLLNEFGITSEELANRKIVAEYKKGKIVLTDVRRGVTFSDEVLDKLREINKNNNSENSKKPEGILPLDISYNSNLINSSNLLFDNNVGILSDLPADNMIISEALKYLRFSEKNKSHKLFTGGANQSRWCAYFVSYVARECGNDNFNFSSVSQILEYGKKNNLFHKTPNVGDAIILKGTNKHGKRVSHTGIVIAVKDGKVETIEGNRSDKVGIGSYSLNDSMITGYVSLS